MQWKDGKSPRPRYHIVFHVGHILSTVAEYTALVQKIQADFPIYDTNAMDGARFFFGNPDTEVFIQDGSLKAQVQPKPGWRENTNIYCDVILPPSERKSASLSGGTYPIDNYEAEENMKNAYAIEQSKTRLRVLEKRKKTIEIIHR